MTIDLSRLAPPSGDRVVVVGGCGGLGRALVTALVAGDVAVTVFDLPASLAAYPPPPGVAQAPLDIRAADSVADAFAGLRDGIEHCVVLSGWTNDLQPVEHHDLADWDDAVSGNLRGSFLAARAAIPLLRAGRPGLGRRSLVLMASGLGFYPRVGFAAYGAAKAGVVQLTRTLALELAPDIRVNVLAPGAVDTAFVRGGTGRGGAESGPGRFTDLEAYAQGVPMRRVAEPDDIAGPALFLMSQAARHITGQCLHINGGGFMP